MARKSALAYIIKEDIIRLLDSKPMSISKIHKVLGKPISIGAVRNYINDLVADGIVFQYDNNGHRNALRFSTTPPAKPVEKSQAQQVKPNNDHLEIIDELQSIHEKLDKIMKEFGI